jgi:hypothetical protein
MIENIRNSVSNRGVETQNVSMFNLYKNLSYTATIRSMGNALIQPTMYFKLQHIPMFEGPYFITEVSHTISPGSFETIFKGVRQSIYAPPTIDTYLSTINENLLTKIQSQFSKTIKNDKVNTDTATNSNQSSTSVPTTSSGCGALLYSSYANFAQNNEINIKTLSSKELYTAITAKVKNSDYANLIYGISYLSSFDNNNFKANHFNFGNIWLTYNRGEITNYNQDIKEFFCAKNLVTSSEQPYAIFPSLDSYIDYMARVIEVINNKVLTTYSVANSNDPTISPVIHAYIIDWLYGNDPVSSLAASTTFAKLNSSGYYDKLKLKIKAASDSIKALSPKEFEVQVDNYVKNENSLNNDKKITKVDEGCMYTYKAPNVITNMSIGQLSVPYNIKITYNTKKIDELFYTENVTKEIEKSIIKLYASNINTEILKFDIIVNSGATGYDIAFIVDIKESAGEAYTGIKILGAKTPNNLTDDYLRKMIKSSQNYNTSDDIIIKSIDIPQFSMNFYYGVYTKINLYPKLE